MSNPNPSHRLNGEELARGRALGPRAWAEKAAERRAFETAFAEAAAERCETPEALRVKLVAELVKQALAGKPWAMELCLAYLFGKPRQALEVQELPPRPEPVDIPPELEERYWQLQLERRALRHRLQNGR